MRTRYSYLGETTIEVVIDGDCVEVNLLPPGPVPAPAPALLLTPDPVPVAAPLELCASAPAPTKKRRTVWGVIRAGWFVAFTAAGEALTYALNNLTSLNLPPGTATAIGAVGYGLKRGLWPDTTL
jgi:hypothetical protein